MGKREESRTGWKSVEMHRLLLLLLMLLLLVLLLVVKCFHPTNLPTCLTVFY